MSYIELQKSAFDQLSIHFICLFTFYCSCLTSAQKGTLLEVLLSMKGKDISPSGSLLQKQKQKNIFPKVRVTTL